VGGIGETLARMVGQALPKAYKRRDYGIACVYTMGGEDHDAVAAKLSSKQQSTSGGGAASPQVLSTKYLGIAGRFFAIGQVITNLETLPRGDDMSGPDTAADGGDSMEPASVLVDGQMVGDDNDEHGCIGSAGYMWCESKSTCIRPWEEECPGETDDASAEGADAEDL